MNTTEMVLDLDELIEEIDLDMVPVVFECFLDDSRDILPLMQDALQQRDSERLRKVAHRIKGCFKSIRVIKGAELAEELEDAARANQLSELPDTLAEFEIEFFRVLNFVRDYLARVSD